MGKAKKCILCNSADKDDIKYGEFLTQRGISAHYFCLLLSSNLVQRGKDNEGILGFLVEDIKEEVRRIENVRCCYCLTKKASIGCCNPKCRRAFHLICGVQHNCENQFAKTYKSFCHRHVTTRKQRPTSLLPNETCCICYDNILDDGEKFNSMAIIRAPCCKNGWFHRWCLALFAKNAGYFFKCPLCNDSTTFRERIPYKGIFIPDRDAAWELEPDAFAELLERPKECSAESCNARGGRQSNVSHNKLEFCSSCGSVARHRKCITTGKKTFCCAQCTPVLRSVDQPTSVDIEEEIDVGSDNFAELSVGTDQSQAKQQPTDDNDSLPPIENVNCENMGVIETPNDDKLIDEYESGDIFKNNQDSILNLDQGTQIDIVQGVEEPATCTDAERPITQDDDPNLVETGTKYIQHYKKNQLWLWLGEHEPNFTWKNTTETNSDDGNWSGTTDSDPLIPSNDDEELWKEYSSKSPVIEDVLLCLTTSGVFKKQEDQAASDDTCESKNEGAASDSTKNSKVMLPACSHFGSALRTYLASTKCKRRQNNHVTDEIYPPKKRLKFLQPQTTDENDSHNINVIPRGLLSDIPVKAKLYNLQKFVDLNYFGRDDETPFADASRLLSKMAINSAVQTPMLTFICNNNDNHRHPDNVGAIMCPKNIE